MTQANDSGERIRERVREGYASVVTGASAGCGCGTGCCAPGSEGVAAQVGYEAEDLASLPEGADLGLSCGNPTAIAALAPGEVVLDLGSGGGIDVFLAGPRVGPAGRAIGVDMTPEMVSKSRAALGAYRARTGLDNVEFRLGEIEHLPVADASVDVVISNCVINLSPDKARVWSEIARVLRPGGRVAVSDLMLRRALPEAVATQVEAWVGCVAGASLVEEVQAMAEAAGLADVSIEARDDYARAMESVQDPLYRKIVEALPAGESLSDYVVSASLTARRA